MLSFKIMYRLQIGIRLIFISILLMIPPALIGSAILGREGVIVGIILALTGIFVIAIGAEKGIILAHGATIEIPKGLKRSLEKILEELYQKKLRILIYPDPTPNALVIRSFGGSGTVLLSQGLVALLNEEEVRSVLRLCLVRIREPGIVFQSFCSLLAVWSLSFAPRLWVNLVFAGRTLTRIEERLLSPISAIGFLVLFPFARFLLNLGRPPFRGQTLHGLGGASSSAIQKISQAVHLWGPGRTQGAFSLYLIDPVSGQMLFSFPSA
jgi:hypothetical protein